MQGVYVLIVSRDNTKAGLGYPQHYLIIANQQHVQATKPSVINRNQVLSFRYPYFLRVRRKKLEHKRLGQE